MHLFLCITLLFSFLAKTYATESYAQVPASVFGGDPTAIIYNAIDVISGSYRETEEDLVLPAPQPLRITRSYASASGQWYFFPHCSLVMGKKQASWRDECVVLTYEKPAIPLVFRGKYHSERLRYDCINGACNTHTNDQNNFYKYDITISQTGIELLTSDHIKRRYQKVNSSTIGPLGSDLSSQVAIEKLQETVWYRLVTEELPEGNTIHYQYSDSGTLSGVKIVSKKGRTYASVSFVYEGDVIHVVANQKNMVSYSFQDGLLKKVWREQKPELTYSYKKVSDRERLVRKELPEGRFLQMDYNEQGKVCALFTPATKEPLFTLKYDEFATHVRDLKQHKKIFRHENSWLECIEKYEGDTLLRKDRFFWDLGGNVVGHVVHDATGKALFSRRFLDESKRESIASSPVTSAAEGITVEEGLGHSIPYDTYDRDATYDKRGNVVQRPLDEYTSILYEYKPGTHTLAKEFLEEHQEIKKRAFYFYDEETGLLNREIRDNGCSKNIEVLPKYDTRKSILEIQPRKYPQNEGDLEVLDEKFYDNKTKQEKLHLRTRHHFDQEGRLIKRELYDAQGSLSKTEEFAYDAHHNLTRYVDPLKNVILYAYDAHDNCISIEECTPQRITFFQYDTSNRPVVKKVQYQNSTVTTSSIYDGFGNLSVSIDRYGNRTEFAYDTFSRLIRITHPSMINEKGERIHPEEHFTYDIFNNVISEKDPKGYLNQYLYDSTGHILEATYANATTERWRYNESGLLEYKLNKDDTVSKFYYDKSEQLCGLETYTSKSKKQCDERISESQYSRDGSSNREKDGRNSTRNSYDNQGRLEHQESIYQNEDTKYQRTAKAGYEYDTLHRPCRIKHWIDDTHFIVECKAYDLLDRVIESWIEQPDGSCTNHEWLAYDGYGNVIKIITDTGSETVEYIEDNRPHIITDASGSITRIEYEECLNALGQYVLRKTIIDPRGVSTGTTYDAFGRQVLLMKMDPFGGLLAKQEFIYDAVGNLAVSLEAVLPKPEEGPHVIRTEWTYGPQKQLLSLCQAVGTKEERTTLFTYSKLGVVDSISYPQANLTFSYEYGKDGQLEKIVNTRSLKTTTFDYTADWQCCGGRSAEGIITQRKFGAYDRVIEEEVSDRFGKYALRYTYDMLGRLTQVKLPDGSSFEYLFEGTRRKAAVRKSADGKELYRQECAEYTHAGLVTSQTLIDGKSQQQTRYTPQGGVACVQTPYYQEEISSFDSTGNPVTMQRQGKELVLSYDFLDQLVEGNSFNSIGNRQKGRYNALNQLIEKDQTRYNYDTQGNVLEMNSPISCETLRYNDWNKLISYQNNNGPTVTYEWDVFGRLIQRNEGSDDSVRRFLYIGDTEIGALDSAGNIIELKIPESITETQAYGACALEFQGVPYLPIMDLFGNIVILVDPQTSMAVEEYEFTAFGQERILAPDGTEIDPIRCKNPWRYRAVRTDPISGFIGFTFRHYDPRMQRFLSEDPLGYLDGSNLYAYAQNNPLIYSDYDGLASRYGACKCHPDSCSFYSRGVCGHGAGVLIDDEIDNTAVAPTVIAPQPVKKRYVSSDRTSLDQTASTPNVFVNTGSAALNGFIDPIDTVWDNAKRVSVFGRAVYNWDFSEYSGMSSSDWGRVGAARLAEAGGIIGGCYVSLERLALSGGAKVLHTVGASKVASTAYNAFKKNCASPAVAAISRNWSLLKNKAQGLYSRVFSRSTVQGKTKITQGLKKSIGYIPTCPNTGRPLPLPRNQHGVNIPSSQSPHTQFGWREGRKEGYRQTREWGYKGKEVKTTDWTDHGRPHYHPNPHDHYYVPNSTGGTPQRGDAIPFRGLE